MKKLTFKPFVLPLLLLVGTIFYYFGELVDWAAWNSLREDFFYGVHDVHRLLFLAPICYAAYFGRIRGAIIITLVSFIIFLPRAFLVSPYPDPLLRMCIFVVFAGVIGVLVGALRNQVDRAERLEAAASSRGGVALRAMENLPEPVVVAGPDYRVHYANAAARRAFGDVPSQPCYGYISGGAAPCPECRLQDVIAGGHTQRWSCPAANGRTYEVLASPYPGDDGAAWSIAALREVSGRE